jgi:hypothetical protein
MSNLSNYACGIDYKIKYCVGDVRYFVAASNDNPALSKREPVKLGFGF